MAPPPAKRRRRNVLQESDDDFDDSGSKPAVNTLAGYLLSSPDRPGPSATATASHSPSPSPARKSTRSATQLHPASSKPVRSQNSLSSASARPASKTTTSPVKSKPRVASKSKPPEKGKSADLVTLFSKQAERAPPKPAPRPSKKLEDITSDPISVSDDDDVGETTPATTSRVGQNAQRRGRNPLTPVAGPPSTASQKFLRPANVSQEPLPSDDQRPWCERFGPVNLEELAVHKKKVSDVRRWLEDVTAGRLRQRLLILKGAAGTGKTTTVRLLAKEMGYELAEWRNPTGSLGAAQGYQSASDQFQEFLGRTGKFGQLNLDATSQPSVPSSRDESASQSRKMILIEEFPNTFMRKSTALTSFRDTVLQYLTANTPSLASYGRQASKDPITPVIMVISETLLTTTSASADSFTAHRLLGPEITRHPGACLIEFNPVAPTLLASALEMIVRKEARKSGRKKTPGPQVLKRIGEIGDIRSAISTLEFLCLKGDSDADWGSRVAFTKPKRGAKSGVALTKGEEESLELVSQREASLGIFHSVGKIVYNKREEQPMSMTTAEGMAESLPPFLGAFSRPKRSEVSVNTLVDETGTDTQTFISALHENYALSCESTGPSDHHSSLDYINHCIEYLSESDLLCPSWDVFFGNSRSGTGAMSKDSASQTLKQDEITFQVATRGLLFSLPSPVKRIASSVGRGGGDAFKMFYPTSIKLWREKEELEDMVDHWSTNLLNGSGHAMTDGAAAFKRTQTSDSKNWIEKQASSSVQRAQKKDTTERESSGPLLSLGSSARREMILERLPYMAQIARSKRNTFTNFRLKELEKVVSFSGIGGQTDEEAAASDDENPTTAESWATDKPTEELSPRKRRVGIQQRSDASVAALPVQKLVLSDDDIEDD